MEISVFPKSDLRIKGKKTTFLVDPDFLKGKLEGDALLFLAKTASAERPHAEVLPPVINGQGEYEILGSKITATRISEDIIYEMLIDGIRIFLAKTSTLGKIKESIDEYKVVILNADSSVEPSLIINMQPSMVIFYGEKAKEACELLCKKAGKDINVQDFSAEIKPINKAAITLEKLPSEMMVVWLQ